MQSSAPNSRRARLSHALWHQLEREIGTFHALRTAPRRNPDKTSRESMAKALVHGVSAEMDFRSLSDAINPYCGVRDRSTSSDRFTWFGGFVTPRRERIQRPSGTPAQ